MQPPPEPSVVPRTPLRRRRTDAQRLADLQAELAALVLAREARPAARNDSPAPPRRARRRPAARRSRQGGPALPDAALEAELRKLVEGFVASLHALLRKSLVLQAQRALLEPKRRGPGA